MHRVTDANNQPTPISGTPDWHLRKIVATCSVVASVICLVFSGQMQTIAEARAAKAEAAVADSEQLAADFAAWQQSRRMVADAAPASADAVATPDLAGLHLAAAETVDADVSDLVAYDFTVLETATLKSTERRCLADAIFFESEHEPMLGKLGVADVVLNYDAIDELAGVILAGMHMPVSRNATHYHANYVSPYWAPSLQPTAQIGTHLFYRTPDKDTKAMVAAAQ